MLVACWLRTAANCNAMPIPMPVMQPSPGERLRRFAGDRVRFTMDGGASGPIPEGWSARLRTNLGRAGVLFEEIIQAHANKLPPAGASWCDVPMQPEAGQWTLELPLAEPGYFQAKGYLIDPQGWQHWPEGPNVGISVHPDGTRTGNTIYCAFTRMFGAGRATLRAGDEEPAFGAWDRQGYTIIPPSGKFRDLVRQLPHILDTLGCRILHLLPINPTPTVYARFGRFGSPYAGLDLTGIDAALVEFDRRTTGVDQFRELTYATHLQGARVFLDMMINHTEQGSNLQESHPEWFLRGPDGSFESPGAWGVTWEDLVELKHDQLALWDYLAEAFLVWCRRGVDGFRCDAGYKVPVPAWQYITTRVRQEFPETVFLLEGLGGSWEITERLLTEGGMQWAYSELFQNYSGLQVAGYLDHSFKQSARAGLLVHYSETHDNERLAARGRAWSLLRNRLCALASVSGGYGFTCGVEWLAPERVNVHSSRGLAWGNPDNLIPELTRLNHLLDDHPCFFEAAICARLSPVDSPVYALRRVAEDGADSVLVLANNDVEHPQFFLLSPDEAAGLGKLKFDLTGQKLPRLKALKDGGIEFSLEPAACHCLSAQSEPVGMSGDGYRRARARAAWGLAALGRMLPIEKIPAFNWRELDRMVDENPAAFLAACSNSDPDQTRLDLERLPGNTAPAPAPKYAPVARWSLTDRRRITPVPPGHWLLIEDSAPFRATLVTAGGARPQHVQSITVREGEVACFPPERPAGDAQLILERYAPADRQVEAPLRFLAPGPVLDGVGAEPTGASEPPLFHEIALAAHDGKSDRPASGGPGQPLVLLTNGIGGMARLCVDLGAITSKYDCLLGANLNPSVPVDRHIFAKRARVWINADGFISPLDLRNLVAFEPGPPARWRFVAGAGDGRTVEIGMIAGMPSERNTTVLRFHRPVNDSSAGRPLPDKDAVRLTVRIDLEDRNFHTETKRNPGAEYHFSTHTQTLAGQIGFEFTPAADRRLRVFSDGGFYHDQPEWSENIPHPVEQSRGQVGSGDAYSPGWFDLPLAGGAGLTLTVCADATHPTPAEIQNCLVAPEAAAAQPTRPVFAESDVFGRQLLRAARAFVVRRDQGISVIAGYPWFLDWGRDSLICARGLLVAGLAEQVKQLLVNFGRFANQGTLPNTIHGDDASNRDTSDAPLWYGIVCEETVARAGEELYRVPVGTSGGTLADVLLDIARNYVKGTPNGIRMDPGSALIWSPSHFTWMDTNHPAGTPREGYPVEIQVLWIRLLRQLQRLGSPREQKAWRDLAGQAEASFHKNFWLEEQGYFADLIAAGPGRSPGEGVVDNSLRCNFLLAVSLGIVSGAPARRGVAAAVRHLVVPGALRSLAPLPVSPPLPIYSNQGLLLNNPSEPYWGRYEGDEDTRRKPAYHNGTAWTWTLPILCEAIARAWDLAPEAVAAASAYLGSMDRLMMNGCLGQIPEILDGDAPHIPRGCDAQAWGVTEALRVWRFLQDSRRGAKR